MDTNVAWSPGLERPRSIPIELLPAARSRAYEQPYLYLGTSTPFWGLTKIGISGDPKRRCSELGLTLLHSWTLGLAALEAEQFIVDACSLHAAWDAEFFRIEPDLMLGYVTYLIGDVPPLAYPDLWFKTSHCTRGTHSIPLRVAVAKWPETKAGFADWCEMAFPT
jgi:hypothetical protein